MLFGSNTLFIEGSQIWGVTENSLMSLGGQKEYVSNKLPSYPDFMNEWYQDIQFKPFKI